MFDPISSRKIPALMATQHPDNAKAPAWSDQAFISTKHEVEEIYRSFFELGCDEYMWDWEGKFADEGLLERLISQFYEPFKEKQIGRDHFITLRVPNIWEEKTFKLARAHMSVLSGAEFMKSHNLHTPPVFEFILPMTKSADQLLHIQDTFQKTAAFHEQIFQEDRFGNGYVHMIPLFESVDDLSHCEEVIRDYLNKHQQKWGSLPPYLRVFIARSDPALNAGLVPAVLASRLALNQTRKIQDQFQIPIHPIIGSGSLPFRGGINPENLDHVLPQYAGAKTLTIQSAFRFDYATEEVTAALKTIQEKLPTLNAPVLEEKEIGLLRGLIETFKNTYRPTLEKMAPAINAMAKFIPQRRERVQHIGLFGYNRGVGEVKLPRAITFTGACYSMGIPPEFIGTGRALKTAEEQGLLPLLEKHFFTLRSELKHAGKYLNLENLLKAAEKHDWAKELIQDVELCQKILQIDLGPSKPHHHLHRNLTSTIRLKNEMGLDFNTDLVEAAVMRKSLG